MSFNSLFSGKNTAIFSFLIFLVYLSYRIVLIFFPQPDVGGVENNVIWFIQRLLDGHPLYTDPESPPYAIAQYSSLYYYITASVGRMTGISPDDVLSVFRLSRTVSLVFNLAYTGVIFLIVRNVFSSSFQKSFIAAVVAFIFLDITAFSRPDSLELLFFFSSFYCFGRWLNKKETGQQAGGFFFFSALFTGLALLSKQSSIVLPAIMLIWFIRKRQFKELFSYFLVFFSLLAVALCFIQYESGLREFYQNTIQGINNGISPYWFFHNILTGFYQEFGLLLVPASVMVLWLLKKEKRVQYRLISISLLLVFITSNLFSLKWGSTPGYFTAWCGLVFIGVAVVGDTLQPGFKDTLPPFLSSVIAFVLLIKMMLIVYPMLDKIRPAARQEMMTAYKKEEQLARLMKVKSGDKSNYTIFNNLYSPSSWLNNLLYRQSVLPQYEVVIFGTWKRKVFNYDRFRKDMEDGTVQYVIVESTGEPLKFMDMNLVKFHPVDSLYGYRIYQYKP